MLKRRHSNVCVIWSGIGNVVTEIESGVNAMKPRVVLSVSSNVTYVDEHH